ncbi:hypothetical protein GCM10027569_90960 [Flindersiella endophytica]
MTDRVDACQGGLDSLLVSYVGVRAVGEVEHRRFMAGGMERLDDMAADEPSAACDEYPHVW